MHLCHFLKAECKDVFNQSNSATGAREHIMTSAERTIALSELARQIAFELNQITPLRPWTFVLPTEDVYSVHLRNAGKARIYIQFDQYENPKRLSVSGYQHIGKNRSEERRVGKECRSRWSPYH